MVNGRSTNHICSTRKSKSPAIDNEQDARFLILNSLVRKYPMRRKCQGVFRSCLESQLQELPAFARVSMC